jgi:hypothetical protein
MNSKAPIQVLDLEDSTNVTDKAVEYLPALPIKALNLRGTKTTGHCLADVGKITTLEELNLQKMKSVTPKELAYLVKLKNLRTLDLSFTELRTGSDCAFIAAMPQLDTLDIHSIQNLGADAEAAKYIVRQAHIAKLSLDFIGLKDDSLKFLGKLKTLRTLSIMGAQVSNKGLEYLSKLPVITNLNLTNTNINHNSVIVLKKFKLKLKRLGVANCDLSPDDLAQLRSALGAGTVLDRIPDMRNWDIQSRKDILETK